MNILLDTANKVKEFSRLAMNFPGELDVASGRYLVPARSMMGLFSLDLTKPIELKFDKKYEDAAKLIFSKFEVNE